MREGVFDGYTVAGSKHEHPASFQVGWKITVSKTATLDPFHEYFVARIDFYPILSDSFEPLQIGQLPITESIELAERQAVLKAIAEWSLDATK